MRRLLTVGLLALGLLGGCATSMKPLDYHRDTAYAPMSLLIVPQGNSRFDREEDARLFSAIKETGAFSFLDTGLPPNGYALVVDQPPGKRGNALVLLNVLTLMTLPIPISYEQHLRGSIFKDGKLLQTFAYRRDGVAIAAWYVPMPFAENQRQMLDQLLRDVEKSRLLPAATAESAAL